MKRKGTGDLYGKMTADESLHHAIMMAAKPNKNKKIVKDILADESKYTKMLQNNFHISGKYAHKQRQDGSNGKIRNLTIAPFFPDRIIHRALIDTCEKAFLSHFSPEVCCALKGRGSLYASRRLRRDLKDRRIRYFIKFDIRHYFDNIDHDILKKQIRNIIKDKRIIDLFDEIIDSTDKGIPIGNYTSQYLANLYLTPLDNYVKHTLKAKKYVRYMDDFVICGSNKRELKRMIPLIQDFLSSNLRLDTHKTEHLQIIGYSENGCHHGEPIDFVGFRHYRDHITIRANIFLRLRRGFMRQYIHDDRKRKVHLASYLGYMMHSDSIMIGNGILRKGGAYGT